MASRTARARILAAALFAGMGAFLFGMDWPLEAPRPISSFGSSSAGGFSMAVFLGAEDSLVKSADEGDLAFSFETDSYRPRNLPSTIGNWMAVEQQRGMVAVYGELQAGSAAGYLTKVKKGAILGTTGSSGWTKAEGLEFRLFDRSAGRWVNPLLLMPVLEDKVPPVVRSAFFIREGKVWSLGDTKSLPQGQYSILVDVADPLGPPPASPYPAPYYLRLVVDGIKVAELGFDVLQASGGQLRISSSKPRSYDECWFQDGRIMMASRLFPRGKSVIQVLVRDYSGNERQASWTIVLE